MALYPVINRAAALANPSTGPVWDNWLAQAPPVGPQGNRPQLCTTVYAVVDGTFGAGGTLVLASSDDGTNFTTVLTLAAALPLVQIGNLAKRFWRASVTAGDGTTALNVSLLALTNI